MLSINSIRPEVIPHCFPAAPRSARLVPAEGLTLRKWVRNVVSLVLREKLSSLKLADCSFYQRGIKRDGLQLGLKAARCAEI